MPRCITSSSSSDGVASSVERTARMMSMSTPDRASRTCAVDISTVFGSPVMRSRPRTTNDLSSTRGKAEPIAILMSSAVLSPIRSPIVRRTYCTIASSISSPPTRADVAATTPPSEMTATSVVPPPMSTIIDPAASWIGRPAPIAAAIGSSMRCASRAPAIVAASVTARFSTSVTPDGMPITTRGWLTCQARL